MSICIASGSVLPAKAATVLAQDGILARLETGGAEALFSWRFVRRPPALVSQVEMTVNGRPMGTLAAIEPFPSQGEAALLSFLIDTGGSGRAKSIEAAGQAVFDVLSSLPGYIHGQIALYDSDYRGNGPGTFTSAAQLQAMLGGKDAASYLSQALHLVIGAENAVPATRRAIYVYTDGFNAGINDLRDLTAPTRSMSPWPAPARHLPISSDPPDTMRRCLPAHSWFSSADASSLLFSSNAALNRFTHPGPKKSRDRLRSMKFLFRFAFAVAIGAMAGNTAALDCGSPHTRVEKAICEPGELRKKFEEFETAFTDALARAPERATDLKATEKIWQEALETRCGARHQEPLKRCIEAQLQLRTKELALLVPDPDKSGEAEDYAPAPSVQTAAVLRPGTYVSDAVMLRLSPHGEFEMKSLSGGREASGHFAFKGGVLTLLNGAGDVGQTKFPLICNVLLTASGFAVKLGQPQCRQLDGIAFRFAS
jgi:uncharacterized protein